MDPPHTPIPPSPLHGTCRVWGGGQHERMKVRLPGEPVIIVCDCPWLKGTRAILKFCFCFLYFCISCTFLYRNCLYFLFCRSLYVVQPAQLHKGHVRSISQADKLHLTQLTPPPPDPPHLYRGHAVDGAAVAQLQTHTPSSSSSSKPYSG